MQWQGGYGSGIGVLFGPRDLDCTGDSLLLGLLDAVRQYARICGLPPEALRHILSLMPVEADSRYLRIAVPEF